MTTWAEARKEAKTSGGGRPPVYRTSSGVRVPGCTTIVGRWKNSRGLIQWAYQQGSQGLDMNETRDNAATVGKIAHSFIDADVHGVEYKPEPWIAKELVEKARVSLGAYLAWKEATKLEIISTETPLVSDRFLFGGTYDALGRIGDQWVLTDWKSSGGIYVDFLYQLGGYMQLIEECTPHRIAAAHLLRVGREFGDFHHHSWSREVLEMARDQFLRLREAYEIDKQLAKAV